MEKSLIFSLVIIAWGKKYLDVFLNKILPGYFSCNNLPLALENFKIETWIYTFKEDVDFIKTNQNFLKLEKLTNVSIFSTFLNNPKKSNKYDIKGYFQSQALKKAINERKALLLFNPDTIIADGGINKCCEIIASGYKALLIGEFARALIEDSLPFILDKFYCSKTKTLTIQNRDLVDIALKNPHPIAKYSFWKKGLFCTWPSFIYWKAGKRSLLAKYFHLHPLALNLSNVNKELPEALMPDDGGLIEFLGIKNKEIYVVENSDEIACVELTSKDLESSTPFYINTKNTTFSVFKWALKAALKEHRRNFLKYNLYFNANENVDWSFAKQKAYRQTFVLRCLFFLVDTVFYAKQLLKKVGLGKFKRFFQNNAKHQKNI